MAIPTSTHSTEASSAEALVARLVLREHDSADSPGSVAGAWWPRTRSLTDELPRFFDAWPHSGGRIHRVLYSPPDWDDRPRSVAVNGRRVKTGSFPRDDTHRLTVTLANRATRVITVIDPQTSKAAAARIMAAVSGDDDHLSSLHPSWDNEGGR